MLSAYCKNDSFISWPSAWTNFDYSGQTQNVSSDVIRIEYQSNGGQLTTYSNGHISYFSYSDYSGWEAWSDAECSYNSSGVTQALCSNGSIILLLEGSGTGVLETIVSIE